MCTGLEPLLLGSMAASSVGNLMTVNSERKQAEEVAAASNQRLNEFLDRNKARETESAAIFDNRVNTAQPEAVRTIQTNAEASRTDATNAAIDSGASAADVPLKGSTATLIGGVYGDADKTARDTAKADAAKANKAASFGDSLFSQDMATTTAGRGIGTVGALAADDANMLPYYQDLAAAQARAKHPVSWFGSLLSGLGKAGSMYAGSGIGG